MTAIEIIKHRSFDDRYKREVKNDKTEEYCGTLLVGSV